MTEFDPSKLPFFRGEKFIGLKEGVGFYEYSVEVAADEVFLMKEDSQIIYVNQSACDRLGYENSELVGKYVWEWDPLFPKEVWPGFWQEFLEKKHLHFETQHQTKLGDVFPVEIHAHLYVENNKNYLLAFVSDLSEKKAIEQELITHRESLEEQVALRTAQLKVAKEQAEYANEAKSQFLSTMSHELRTPLTSIKGTLALISSKSISDPEQINEMLSIAYRNSERLERLVNDILDFEKLRRKGIEFCDEVVNIVKLVKNAIKMEEGFAKKFNIEIVLDVGNCGEVSLKIDPHRIQQVIANLISNAIKFSPSGDQVLIQLTSKEDGFRFSVIDHGKGIDDRYRNKVFRYFSQVDESDTREKGGSGLGLAISKEIISHYNGNIDFVSNPKDGTCFFFELGKMQGPIPH